MRRKLRKILRWKKILTPVMRNRRRIGRVLGSVLHVIEKRM